MVIDRALGGAAQVVRRAWAKREGLASAVLSPQLTLTALLGGIAGWLCWLAGDRAGPMLATLALICGFGGLGLLLAARTCPELRHAVQRQVEPTERRLIRLRTRAVRRLCGRALVVTAQLVLAAALASLAFPGRVPAAALSAGALAIALLAAPIVAARGRELGWVLDEVISDRLLRERLVGVPLLDRYRAGWTIRGRLAGLRAAAMLHPDAPEAARQTILAQYAPAAVSLQIQPQHKGLAAELSIRRVGWPVALGTGVAAALLCLVLTVALPPGMLAAIGQRSGLSGLFMQPDEAPPPEEPKAQPESGSEGSEGGPGDGSGDASDQAGTGDDSSGGADGQGASQGEAGSGQGGAGAGDASGGTGDPREGQSEGGGSADPTGSEEPAEEGSGGGAEGDGGEPLQAEESAGGGQGTEGADDTAAGGAGGGNGSAEGQAGAASADPADAGGSGTQPTGGDSAGTEPGVRAAQAGPAAEGAPDPVGSGTGPTGADDPAPGGSGGEGAGEPATDPAAGGAGGGGTGPETATSDAPPGPAGGEMAGAAASADPTLTSAESGDGTATDTIELVPPPPGEEPQGPGILLEAEIAGGTPEGSLNLPAPEAPEATEQLEGGRSSGEAEAGEAPDLAAGSDAQLYAKEGEVPEEVRMDLSVEGTVAPPPATEPSAPRQPLPAWIRELTE